MGDSEKAQQLLQDSSWAWIGLDWMGFLGFFYGFLMVKYMTYWHQRLHGTNWEIFFWIFHSQHHHGNGSSDLIIELQYSTNYAYDNDDMIVV